MIRPRLTDQKPTISSFFFWRCSVLFVCLSVLESTPCVRSTFPFPSLLSFGKCLHFVSSGVRKTCDMLQYEAAGSLRVHSMYHDLSVYKSEFVVLTTYLVTVHCILSFATPIMNVRTRWEGGASPPFDGSPRCSTSIDRPALSVLLYQHEQVEEGSGQTLGKQACDMCQAQVINSKE